MYIRFAVPGISNIFLFYGMFLFSNENSFFYSIFRCNIDNCIIGPKALVKKGTKLKNCLVGANFVVEEGSQLEAKHLTHADGYMEIDIQ